MPYSGRYAVSGSGLLYEGIYGRKFLIVGRGSTLASELTALGYPHSMVDPDSATDLARAVAEVRASWPEIWARITAFHQRHRNLPAERFAELFEDTERWFQKSEQPG